MDNQQLLAILVDRYLQHNNFSQTRTTFRNEAASFIFSSTIINDDQLLVNVLSLDKILEDLILLNEEKKMMLNERDKTRKLLQCMESVMYSYYKSFNVDHQERLLMEREKYQINLLVFRLQSLINNYGIESLQTTNILMSPPLPNANSVVVPQSKFGNRTPMGTISLPKSNLPKPPLPNSAVLFPTGVNTSSDRFLVPQPIIIDTTAITNTQKTPNVLAVPPSINEKNGNFSTPVMSVSDRKRKDIEATNATSIGKKSRGRPPSGKITVQGQNTLPQSNNVVIKQAVSQPSTETQSIARNVVPSGSNIQNSSVGKCLFNPPINLPVPKTPTRTTSSQSDADISHTELCRVPPCNGEATPNLTNRVIVSLSPQEQMEYIMSSNCISSYKTDSDKGSKRDFDASDMLESLDKPMPNEISTYESNKQNDLSELSNLTFYDDNDDLGTKFSLFDDNDMGAEFSFNDDDLRILVDVLNDDQNLPCKGVNFSDHPTSDQSNDNGSRFSHECEGEQVISELLPSTVVKVLSEKDINIQGLNSLTAMKSF